MKEYHYLITLDVTSDVPFEDGHHNFICEVLDKVDPFGEMFLGQPACTRIHHHKNSNRAQIFKAMRKALTMHGNLLIKHLLIGFNLSANIPILHIPISK